MNSPLQNPKHEHFAVLVATGEDATSAYVASGYSEKGAARAASQLLNNAQVRARIATLGGMIRERAIEKAGITRADVLARLEQVRLAAEKSGDFDAAVSAAELIGRASGIFEKHIDTTRLAKSTEGPTR
jgi:hypothetical protein